MTENHLLSASLFAELFQHNIVSSDGRIIANEKQLEDYYSFLIQQSKDKVNEIYVQRQNMVKDAQELLKKDIRSTEEIKMLKRLLNGLHLDYKDNVIHVNKQKTKEKRYTGPKEPLESLLEREIGAELNRIKVLKRDLKELDDWLEVISKCRSKGMQQQDISQWKESERKFRQRTKNRMSDMERARINLIKHHYNDYDRILKSVLGPASSQKLGKEEDTSGGELSESEGQGKDKTENKSSVSGKDELDVIG